MAVVRFVHAADLHLDTPFQGVARPAPEIARALRDASLQAWENLVQLTMDREAAFLLLAGDIYDGAERGMRAQLRFADGLRRLADAGIRVFVVHGNHDPLGEGWSAIREWPDGVTVFGSDGVQTVGFEVDGTAVAVHGISYPTRAVTENLALKYRRHPDASLNIGLLHANAGGATEHAAYAPCTLTDLESAGMDYWALGHIHQRAYLRRGGPWIAYPGDTQGRSPKPSETGPKGVLMVEVKDGAIEEPEFVPVDVVRFVTCLVDIAGVTDVAALQERVAQGVEGLRAGHEGRALLVRVVLQGRGAVAADLQRGGALDEFVGELRQLWQGREPFVWIEAVKDRARGELDMDALRARGDFAAELLKLADGLEADEVAAEAFVAEAAGRLRAPGQVERALRDVGDDAAEPPREVLAAALELALDRLEAEAQP